MNNIRDFLKDFITFLYLTGLRFSEGAGLMWEDIDFEKGTISIKRIASSTTRNIYTTPKTEKSCRIILFNNTIKDILLKRKNDIQKLINLSDGYYNSDLVFANQKGNSFINADFVVENKRISKLLKKHFTFHSLRHSHATFLVEQGVNIKAIQERLGHENISTTLKIYSHVTDKIKEEVLPVLDNILK